MRKISFFIRRFLRCFIFTANSIARVFFPFVNFNIVSRFDLRTFDNDFLSDEIVLNENKIDVVLFCVLYRKYI